MTTGQIKNEDKEDIESAEITLLRKRADAYWLLQEKVHIPFKKGHHWKRGLIIEVKNEFFILDEVVEGRVPVFFTEILDIRKYVGVKEREEKDDMPKM